MRKLAISTGDSDNEARMRLSSLLRDLNSHAITPTYDDLLRQFCDSNAYLQMNISEVQRNGYIQIDSELDETGRYKIKKYRITDKGKYAYERYVSRVNFFMSIINQQLEDGTIDELYKTIDQNRDLLLFAYSTGLIAKAEIEKIAKSLS